MEVSRRGWILGIGVTWAEIAAAQSDSPPQLEVLDAAMAAEVEALAAQIIPSDDGPGAKEAGVIYFIDRALATFDQDQREIYRAGLATYMTGLAAGRSGLATHGSGLTASGSGLAAS